MSCFQCVEILHGLIILVHLPTGTTEQDAGVSDRRQDAGGSARLPHDSDSWSQIGQKAHARLGGSDSSSCARGRAALCSPVQPVRWEGYDG